MWGYNILYVHYILRNIYIIHVHVYIHWIYNISNIVKGFYYKLYINESTVPKRNTQLLYIIYKRI